MKTLKKYKLFESVDLKKSIKCSIDIEKKAVQDWAINQGYKWTFFEVQCKLPKTAMFWKTGVVFIKLHKNKEISYTRYDTDNFIEASSIPEVRVMIEANKMGLI